MTREAPRIQGDPSDGSVIIRAAREDDLTEIVALLADDDLERERLGEVPSTAHREAFEEIDRDARNNLVVVEEAGRVIATLQLTYVPSLTHESGERAQVEGVRVAESHRSRGVGRMLLGCSPRPRSGAAGWSN